MDYSRYLQRIKFSDRAQADDPTLKSLHEHHVMFVPFENLDIHYRKIFDLEIENIFRKVVENVRGGFCYELNYLFNSLLNDIGFSSKIISSRVFDSSGVLGPEFDHMSIHVRTDKDYLADVGFGDSFREPLRLDHRGEQEQNGEYYRIVDAEEHHLVLERRESEKWKPQYRFTLEPYELSDFDEMCRYHQTSPESPFTQKRVCTRATPEGRITISNMRAIVTERGVKQERELSSHEEWTAALREYFGIELNQSELPGKLEL